MQASRSARLLVWGLSTFHTALFFAVFVAVLYLNGGLGNLLASLNTLIGSAVYALLWFTTWLTTRGAWRALNWRAFDEPLDVLRLLGTATIFGGVNGMLFLSCLAVVAIPVALAAVAVQAVQSGRPEQAAQLIPASILLVFALAIAEGVAFVLGAFVGLLFAVVDGLLIAGAGKIARVA